MGRRCSASLAGLHRGEGRLEPLGRPRHRGDVRRADRADHGRSGPRARRGHAGGAVHRRPRPRPSTPGSTVVDRLPATRETGHHLLVLGLLCWGTGQFAASAVFRHRRPLSAVVVIGAILIGNMAATVRRPARLPDPVQHRRPVPPDPAPCPRRAGDLDAAPDRRPGGGRARSICAAGRCSSPIAVVGSLVLTATRRASAPLAGAWEDVKPVAARHQRGHPAIPSGRRRQPRLRECRSSARPPSIQTSWSHEPGVSR